VGQDSTRKLSAFGLAAIALDQELAHFEVLTERAVRTGLDSRKGIEKAATAAAEATQSRQRLAEHMGVLASALGELRTRNEGLAARLEERMREIDARMGEARELTEQANALGQLATEIAAAAQGVTSNVRAESGLSPENATELAGIVERLDGLIADGRKLAVVARERNLPELADEIEALRQQLQGARNRANLAVEKIGTRGSS
jgi:chromosome segregation ATPase